MSSPIDGLPPDVVQADVGSSTVSFTIDTTTYPLEAIYGASYVFIDRCYVLLDRPEAGKVRVSLAPKKGAVDAETMRTVAGEFGNELLGCAWRAQITQQNRAVIEALTTQALAGAMGPPSLDELASFDFTEESFEDPLGIAMSWEDKYKKKDAKDEAAAAATVTAAAASTASATSEPAGDKGGAA
jgi:His-Xaa-Ser system protein HxsD